MLDALMGALPHMGTAIYWFAFFVGIALASAVGLLPGVGSTIVMAVALPVIVLHIEDPAIGIVLLAVITGTSNTFDSIPAQLMGIVNAGTQVTFLEGHQLTRRGLGAYSMGAVYAVSAIGGLVGAAFLLLALPFLRPVILKFSFAEIAALALFGIGMVSVLSRGAMLKGLTSGLIGLFIGTVGLQGYTGTERFTFGSYDLLSGLPLVATVLGVMAIPEMLDLAVTRKPIAPENSDVSTTEVFRGFKEGLRRWRIAIRHSLFGVGLGAIPGAGGSVVTWLSYGMGMALSKDKSQFGKGSLDGLLFAESSENSKEAGQAIPTLALGVPASTSWALVVVAMASYGITPGPDTLRYHMDIVGLIVISFALANLVVTMFALVATRQIMRVTAIPYAAIVATILPVVVVGAYLGDPISTTLPVILVFSILGLLMKHFGWPRPPLVLGFILGPVIEDNLWTAISIDGVVNGVLKRPLTIFLVCFIVVTVVFLHRSMSKASPVGALVNAESLDAVTAAVSGVSTGLDEQPLRSASPVSQADTPATQTSLRIPKFYWRNEHILPILILVIALCAAVTARGFQSPGARFFPLATSTCIIVLTLIQLIRQTTRPDSDSGGAVMDLPMRSAGMSNVRRSVLLVGGLIALYLVAIVLIGLPLAGLVFAFVAPLCLMNGRGRWLTSVISVLLVAAFTYGLGNSLLHVFWPTSVLGG